MGLKQKASSKQSSRSKILQTTHHAKDQEGQHVAKGAQKAPSRSRHHQLLPPTVKLKVEVRSAPKKSVASQANNASAPAVVTPSADFVADPEPVRQCDGFLCTFTLLRPGLVGLNKLAVYLNDLQDSGSIGGWQANGWEDAATKVRALIGFANHADAIIGIKGVR